MHLQAGNAGSCGLLRLSGDVQLADAGALARALRKMFTSEPDCVICDLTSLDYLDERCALMFVTVGNERPWPGAHLFLVGAVGEVRRVLEALGVHRWLRMTDSLSTALASVNERPPQLREMFIGNGDQVASRRARRFADDVCARWGLSEAEPTVELVVSELVTNAHRHAGTAFQLLLHWRDDRLRVAVRDWGPGLSTWPEPPDDPLVEGGEGLHIVAMLSDGHGVNQHPGGGNVVWAALPAPATVRTGEPQPGPDVRAERTVRESPSGSWRLSMALSWTRSRPRLVELQLIGDPPHPTLQTGRWFVRRDALLPGGQRADVTGGMSIGPDLNSGAIRLNFDMEDGYDLPASWLRAFLDQTAS